MLTLAEIDFMHGLKAYLGVIVGTCLTLFIYIMWARRRNDNSQSVSLEYVKSIPTTGAVINNEGPHDTSFTGIKVTHEEGVTNIAIHESDGDSVILGEQPETATESYRPPTGVLRGKPTSLEMQEEIHVLFERKPQGVLMFTSQNRVPYDIELIKLALKSPLPNIPNQKKKKIFKRRKNSYGYRKPIKVLK